MVNMTQIKIIGKKSMRDVMRNKFKDNKHKILTQIKNQSISMSWMRRIKLKESSCMRSERNHLIQPYPSKLFLVTSILTSIN